MKKHHKYLLKSYGSNNQGISQKGTNISAAMDPTQPKMNHMLPIDLEKSNDSNAVNQQ